MKFSDMMGKDDQVDETTETQAPPARMKAPPLPEAPIRFGAPPEVAEAPPAAAEDRPAILDVMAELAPRPGEVSAASTEQLDATAWLEGLVAIDDDLLPS